MSGSYRNDNRRDIDRRDPGPLPSLWRQHHDDDGTPYWYHVETRETTWHRPSEYYPPDRRWSPEARQRDSAPLPLRGDRRTSFPNRQDPDRRSSRPPMMPTTLAPLQRTHSLPARAPAAIPPSTSRQSSVRRSRDFVPESQRTESYRTASIPTTPTSALPRRTSSRPPPSSTPTPSSPTKAVPAEPLATGPSDFELILGRMFDARKAAASTFQADLELTVVDTRLDVLNHRLHRLEEALLD